VHFKDIETFAFWEKNSRAEGNTCPHPEHRSQAQQRRLYCQKWETSTVPNYKKTFRVGRSFSFVAAVNGMIKE
jgi:hypothetical protein